MSTETAHGAPIAPGADAVERLLAELNPPQREAVTHGEGPLLVLAGAGSGKTRVLTHRIAWLLATGRARPSEILAITFTNKAASEMRERVEALVGGVSRVMWVMTFHSACARILRADAERLGYKRAFTIYDEADSVRMVKRCMEELEHRPEAVSAARGQGARSRRAKNQLIDPTDYGDAAAVVLRGDGRRRLPPLRARMVEASAMDFDDLLVRTVNLLELFADVREKYRRIFRWVLVDEYQDTNRAQYRLLQLLARGAPQPDRASATIPVGLRLPRRRHPQHPRLRARLPRRRGRCCSSRTTARPRRARRRQRADRPQREPEAQAPVDRRRTRASQIVVAELDDEHAEARYVASEVNRLVEEGIAARPRSRSSTG